MRGRKKTSSQGTSEWLARMSWVVVAITMLTGAMPCGAQADVQGRCELLPKKTQVLVCEPLVVDLRLTNIGSRELYVPRSASLEQGCIRVTYTRPDGTQRHYMPLEHFRAMGERQAVPPGGSFYRRLFLAYSSDIGPELPCEYLFSSPGVYRIQASIVAYDQPAGGTLACIESEPIEVTAVEPGGADAEALKLFRGKEQGFALHFGAVEGLEEPKEFDALSSEYSQTIYGQHVQYTRLVSALRDPGFGLLIPGHETPPEVRAPFEQLEAFVQAHDAFPALDELMFYLAEYYNRTGERERADGLRAEILSRFPETAVAAQVTSQGRVVPGKVWGIVSH